jgi:hypothetical protein
MPRPLRLIAGTVKIPLIESDAFRPGDKACRNAAQTADFTSRHITADVESFLVNIERRVRRAPHDGSQFALDPIKRLSSDRRSGVLLKIEISPRRIVAAAVRAKQCERRPNQEHAACSKDVEAGLIGATWQRQKRRHAGTTAKRVI